MIITQPKEQIAAFVAERIETPPHWGEYSALALVDKSGIVAGVVYNNFSLRDGGYQDCSMHVAARPNSKWATRDFLNAAFSFPFLQMGCKRVTGLVASKNTKARKFDEHLGFEYEATLKDTHPDDDTIVYRMYAKDCKWIKTDRVFIKPDEIIPIHEAWDKKRLDDLTASMKEKGWNGRPVLALNVNGRRYAMTGTHRIKAAQNAGIDIPIKDIDTNKTSDQLLANI